MGGGVAGVRCMFDVFFTFSIQLFLGVFEMSSWKVGHPKIISTQISEQKILM
jgi:hypothetical protein